MDFIVGLPNTSQRHDSIWVIVDRLTKTMWQNQPELHRLKYASPLSRAPTYFKRCNPLAYRVESR
jgi:hypothetical protein